MATWHCPACGLSFTFRSELEWHAREQHRVQAHLWAPVTGRASRGTALTWAQLRELDLVPAAPSVSLLMGTSRAAVMGPCDRACLACLAGRARRLLALWPPGAAGQQTGQHLELAVAAAEAGPTDVGLAVLANPSRWLVVPLPFRPRERAVIGSAFVTRDLLESLELFPAYRVVVLGSYGFRVLEGRARWLHDVASWHVASSPGYLPGRLGWLGPREPVQADRPALSRQQRVSMLLDKVDRAVSTRVALAGELPLLVAGDARLVEAFRRRSSHSASIAGTVGNVDLVSVPRHIAERAAAVVGAWSEHRLAGELGALREADRQGRVVWGLDQVRQAVSEGRVVRLWVEHGYEATGDSGVVLQRASAGGSSPPGGRTGPFEASWGPVDEVVHLALARGAQVDIVRQLRLGPAGEHPAGEHPAGEHPAAEHPAGEPIAAELSQAPVQPGSSPVPGHVAA